jgi:hypothetical protein
MCCNTLCLESCFVHRLQYIDLVVSIEVALKCAVVSLCSVKQRLKCNTGKLYHCLIQILLPMVLSIEERVFISALQLSERIV